MRVNTGKYKGRKLLSPMDESVRPTPDRVKQAIFNVLQWQIRGCRFLDLFAGSGAVGIEAISRGAEYVEFSDASKDSIALVNRNLTGITFNGQVVKRDFRQCLDSVRTPFDIIFLDPPYDTDFGEAALNIIFDRKLLAKGGVAVFEHRSGKRLSVTERSDIYVDQRSYGYTTSVLFLHYAEDMTDDDETAVDADEEIAVDTDEIPDGEDEV